MKRFYFFTLLAALMLTMILVCPALGEASSLINDIPLANETAQDPISYIRRAWNGSTVTAESGTCECYTILASDITTWSSGWYVVASDIQSIGTIQIEGNVDLILCDGYTLNAKYGIRVNDDSALTIYGQSEESGKLISKAGTSNSTGIGGSSQYAAGPITIHSGYVEATGTGAAGIGSGRQGTGNIITIYGGTVKSTGGNGGAGIGGSYEGVGTTVAIFGGDIYATGGSGASGIGGGDHSSGDTVTTYGGRIHGYGENGGAGIGGGKSGKDCTVAVNGGTIWAYALGSAGGAGIGSGIMGGTVSGHTSVTITGGNLTAQGVYGAGIGGGEQSQNIEITISGGTISARSVGGIGKCGAGIGGGYQGGSTKVIIRGGTVKATSDCSEAIGKGLDERAACAVTLNDMKVSAGSGEPGTPIVCDGSDSLITACQNPYAKVVPCESHSFTFGGFCEHCGKPGLKVTFINWDGAELQSDWYDWHETPVYTGEWPAKPADEDCAYAFAGWSPEIGRIEGDTVYTARYEAMSFLHTDDNALTLSEYQTVGGLFTPEENGYYRFHTSTDGTVSLQLRLYDDQRQELPLNAGVGLNLDNYTAELIGGQRYILMAESIAGAGNVTINIQPASMYHVTVDPEHPHGEVGLYSDTAWAGALIPFEAVPDEDDENEIWYGVAKITVTQDSDGTVVPPDEDWAYIMPNDDVTVHVRFDRAYPIRAGETGDENNFAMLQFVNGKHIMANPKALAGKQISISYWLMEGCYVDGASVVTDSGENVPCTLALDYTYADEIGGPERVIRFTMPADGITVTLTAQDGMAFGIPDFTLPNDLRSVKEEAFEGAAMKVADVPNGCTSIGDRAFKNCRSLRQIRIPADCVLGAGVFDGCETVYVFSAAGSSAQAYCQTHDNCVFVMIE